MNSILNNRIINLHNKGDKKCSICIDAENLINIENGFATTCGHIFHTECIQQYFDKCAHICPLCKESQNIVVTKLEIERFKKIDDNERTRLIKQLDAFKNLMSLENYDHNDEFDAEILIIAVEANDMNIVTHIVANDTTYNNITIEIAIKTIFASIENNNFEIFNYLLSYYSDIIDFNDEAISEEMYFTCIKNNSIKILDELIEMCSIIPYGEMLVLAIKYNHFDSIMSINDYCGGMDNSIIDGSHMFDLAIKYDCSWDIIDLLNSMFDIEFSIGFQDAIQILIRHGNINAISYIMDNLTHDTISKLYIKDMLMICIAHKQIDIFEIIIDNIKDNTYLDSKHMMLAIESSQLNVVSSLVNNGFKCTDEFLLFSINDNKAQIARYLCEHTDIEIYTPILHSAYDRQYIDIVDRIFYSYTQHYLEDDSIESKTYTLTIAVIYKKHSIVRMLLEAGADIHRNKDLLQIAINQRCKSMTRLLMNFGAVNRVKSTNKKKMDRIHKFMDSIHI